MNHLKPMKDHFSDNSEWKHTYWIVFLLGIAYVLVLGLFTLFFNSPS